MVFEIIVVIWIVLWVLNKWKIILYVFIELKFEKEDNENKKNKKKYRWGE